MIDIQNIDYNECFKWSIVRYLNQTDHNLRRIVDGAKNLLNNLILNAKFPVKIRGLQKIEKKNSIGIMKKKMIYY